MSIIHGKNLIVYIILRSFLFNFYSFIEKNHQYKKQHDINYGLWVIMNDLSM